ncbi:hypothetical protein ACQ4PT_066641 [Festuca glaucescens]
MEHYPPLAHVDRFPREILTQGDLDLRPARGHCVISCTLGMAALEADFTNRALLAADFFISFASAEDCTRVLELSGQFRCGGATIGFRRWHRSVQATSAKLELLTKLSIEGLPANAWDWEAISQLINKLGGQLVEILPSTNHWCMMLTAWLRNPWGVPKEFDLKVPEPEGLQDTLAFTANPSSPPPACALMSKRTLVHPLLIHAVEVIDRTAICLDLPKSYVNDEEDMTRKHTYPWWGGRVDGTGRGPAQSSGHAFACTEMDYTGGDWGRHRSHGLLAPAGGIPALMMTTRTRRNPKSMQTARAKGHSTDTASSTAVGSPAAEASPISPSTISTAIGLTAQTLTPVSPAGSSVASTAVGSAAKVLTPSTPPLRRSHCTCSARRHLWS